MVKRAFTNHRLAIILVAINSAIVVEEFAHVYLYPPSNHHFGLGWYWTAVLSLPSSILWYLVSERFSSDFLCMLSLLLVGGFQWGIIGALLDRSRRGRSSAKT
jgi:hypothetical protein